MLMRRRQEKHLTTEQTATADSGSRHVLVGLVGKGIQKSRTPAMHMAEGAAQGFSYEYRLIDTDIEGASKPLEHIVREAEAAGFAGLNITYPYKVEIISFLDELSDAAKAVGAVNTVVFQDGKRKGHNTDFWGFAEGFKRNMADAAREHVLLVGAGGAGAAVAHALVQCGVSKLWISDLDQNKAGALAAQVCNKHGSGRAEATSDVKEIADILDGIINATPVGMAKMPGLSVPDHLIQPRLWVGDIVYFPLETELLKTARERGCRTLSGAGMAVFQAVRAFELFTGTMPDVARMEATFKAFDSAQQS